MARVFFLFALLALSSVGAYNKYEGGQNKKIVLIKKKSQDAMAKYKKWQQKYGGTVQIRSIFIPCVKSLFPALNR